MKDFAPKNKSGENHGKHTYYHNNGKIWRNIEYHNGLIHGNVTDYNTSGKIVQIGNYVFGMKIRFHFYYGQKSFYLRIL